MFKFRFVRVSVGLFYCCALIVATNVGASEHVVSVSKHYHNLDGLQFTGKTGEQGKGDDHDDIISFNAGKFRSIDCENWGFSSAPYVVERVGDTYHFRSTLRSLDLGRLEWKGTITGNIAKGTFRWIHERWYWDIDRAYWYEGTLQSIP